MESEELEPRVKRVQRRVAEEEFEEEQAQEQVYVNIDAMTGSVRKLLAMENVANEVGRRFQNFISTFRDPQRPTNELLYFDKMGVMCQENKESLEVSYRHMALFIPRVAGWLADCPGPMLEILDREATRFTVAAFPDYGKYHPKIHVRIHDLPIQDSLRDLRHHHLNGLIKTSGVVTRRTNVIPQLSMIRFNCQKCGYLIGPFLQSGDREVQPGSCPECQSKGPFTVNQDQTVYRNYQKITIQESPGTVPPGRIPRTKEVILLYDLIDQVKPGEEVEVTGLYVHNYDTVLNTKSGFPVFATVIEANYLSKKDGISSQFSLTSADTDAIHKLSKKPDLLDRIVRSIAPSIYGMEEVKTAVALALFGGEAIEIKDRPPQRGDINILILGDPGCAKSQILKYVEKTSHRAIYTTGKGASAVGLTASVHMDAATKEWTLEGGALVLADRGVCLIDEFDKMNDQDRTSIHEAMEQQTISISKAGIVTQLKARCAVIAAANPIGGKYESNLNFSENVELTDPILSRFDVLCVVRDTVDATEDERLAKYVVSSHARSHPLYNTELGNQIIGGNDVHGVNFVAKLGVPEESKIDDKVIPQSLLRKYILYARSNVHPKIDNVDSDKIANLYVELRNQSAMNGAVPIAVRHLQSLLRMSQAHAKMHLRERVREDDVDLAIRVMLESFVSAQRYAVMNTMRKHFAKFITYKKDHNELLLHCLLEITRQNQLCLKAQSADYDPLAPLLIDLEEFESKARELEIYHLSEFYGSQLFSFHGFVYQQAEGKIIKHST